MHVFALVPKRYVHILDNHGLFSLKYVVERGLLDIEVPGQLMKNEGFLKRYGSIHFGLVDTGPTDTEFVAAYDVNTPTVYVYNRNYAHGTFDHRIPMRPRDEYLMSGMPLSEFLNKVRTNSSGALLDPKTAEPMHGTSMIEYMAGKGKYRGVTYNPEALVEREVIPKTELKISGSCQLRLFE